MHAVLIKKSVDEGFKCFRGFKKVIGASTRIGYWKLVENDAV